MNIMAGQLDMPQLAPPAQVVSDLIVPPVAQILTVNVKQEAEEEEDDLISCRICLELFDEQTKLPKYLNCFHYFCHDCLKKLATPRQLMCPTCRAVTKLNSRHTLDHLFTNQLALRDALKIVTDRENQLIKLEKEKAELRKKKWCVTCKSRSSNNCAQESHQLQDGMQVYSICSMLLKSRISRVRQVADDVIDTRTRIKKAFNVILPWISWMYDEISRRNESNNDAIARLKVLSTLDESTLPNLAEDEDDKFIIAGINQVEKLIIEFGGRYEEAEQDEPKAKELLLEFLKAHERSSPSLMTLKGERASVAALADWISELDGSKAAKHLDDYRKGGGKTPIDKDKKLTFNDWVSQLSEPEVGTQQKGQLLSVLSFLASLFTPEETKPVSVSDIEPVASGSGEQSRPGKRSAEESADASSRKAKRVKVSSVTPPPTLDENVFIDRPPSALNTFSDAYFDICVPDRPKERLVFRVDQSACTGMASRFLEYCLGVNQPGFLGTLLNKIPGDPLQTKALDKIPSLVGGQICGLEEELFVAEKSPLPAKFGSICFIPKEVNPWGTIVSPEFQIILSDPADDSSHDAVTTVFGQLIQGTNFCQYLQTDASNSHFPIEISDCGLL